MTSLKACDWWWGLLLTVATLFAYQPVWHAGFIWDDDAHVTKPALRSLQGLWQIWAEPGAAQQYYPLVHSVFWLEHRVWGDRPMGYHLVNVLLHIGCALLLRRILRRLEVPGAWLAAAIFALHPVQVETVAWVSELKNTLSGVLGLGAVLIYLGFDESRRHRLYAGALILFVLGLLCKTVIATLPAALLVVFWWKRGRISWRGDVIPLVPFFAAGIGAGLFTAWMERHFIGADGSDFAFSLLERCLIAGRDVWFYLGKLIWPANLTFIYPRWQIDSRVWWQALFPIAVVVLAMALWVGRHRARGPLAAFLYFVGTLFPALGFVNVFPFVYSFVADHFQYLACIGPITLAAAGFSLAPRVFGRRGQGWLTGIALGLVMVLGTLTWRQARIYRDKETLWTDTLEKNPGCWMALNNMGLVLRAKHQLPEAMDRFARSVQIRPANVEAILNWGEALMASDQPTAAIAKFQEAIRGRAAYPEAFFNWGKALMNLDRTEEAVAKFQEAIRINPAYADAYIGLGGVLLHFGKADEANLCFQLAYRLQPEARICSEWGRGLALQRKEGEALAMFREAIRLDPGFVEAHLNLGMVFFLQGDLPAAAAAYREAIRYAPLNTAAHERLAEILLRQGNSAEAVSHYEAAIRINPSALETRYHFGLILKSLGRERDAVAAWEEVLKIQPSNGAVANELAWVLATSPDDSIRNGSRAVDFARQAERLSGGKDPSVLDTLAAAYAEAGRFSEALDTARVALSLAEKTGESSLAENLRREIAHYENGRPWRDRN